MRRRGIAGAAELALIVLSASALTACGARSSLTGAEVDTGCGPWSVREGEVGVASSAGAPFAVLGDGSVVLPTLAIVQGKGGAAPDAKSGRYVLGLDPGGAVVWDTPLGDQSWMLQGVARGDAEAPVVLAVVTTGTHTVLGATVTCPGPSECILVGKLGETGTMGWSKLVPGGNLTPRGLAATRDGRITVEVTFDGTVDFGCGPVIAPAGVGGATRALARLSAAGECQWSRAIVGTTPLYSIAADRIAVNDDGEIALTMMLPYAEGEEGPQTLDLGGGPLAFDTKTALGLAVAKYADDGSLVFGKVVSGTGMHGQVVLPSAEVALTGAGEILLSMTYEGTLDLGGGPQGSPGILRQFVAALSAAGEERWIRDLASATSDDVYGTRAPFAIAAEPGGGFLLAGRGQPGMTSLGEPTPETTVFVAAHDAGGKPVSVHRFPFTGRAAVAGIDASTAGALVLAGHFAGTLDLGQDLLVSEGAEDVFVAKLCR
jgi:hypothetical protein